MLVLSRKCGEKLMIGDDIVVTIISVHGERVRIGLNAPREVSIRREELRPLSADRVASGAEVASPAAKGLAPIS